MRDFAPPEGAVLSVRDLTLSRAGRVVLAVPDLALDRPGPTLILGPNGAGKSLLLRCLHGLEPTARGVVRQDGQDLGRVQRARQAMVFQRPVLLRRSVAGNLDYVLRRQRLGRDARRRRIAELLAEGGLAGKAGQPARSLSGGEGQRLAILRAMAMTPDVLFLDEPTSALDPAATQAVERLIGMAAAGGTRIVMVSHDIGQARRLGRDIVFMHAGEVAERAAAETFFEAPRTRAARQFLSGALVV
jgi:tungstate transport system ATP-binding protein